MLRVRDHGGSASRKGTLEQQSHASAYYTCFIQTLNIILQHINQTTSTNFRCCLIITNVRTTRYSHALLTSLIPKTNLPLRAIPQARQVRGLPQARREGRRRPGQESAIRWSQPEPALQFHLLREERRGPPSRGHAERPHPQKSDLIDLHCSE